MQCKISHRANLRIPYELTRNLVAHPKVRWWTRCDHIEEQISGVRLWGKNFIAARVPPRNANSPETSLWQIYGAEDGTTVTLTAAPQVTGLPNSPFQLNKGQLVEFFAGGPVQNPGDFEITADKPIAVMNYMTGAENMPAPFQSTGDPPVGADASRARVR